MKKIILAKGQEVLVDDEDYEGLRVFKWRWSSHSYARRNGVRLKGSKIQPTIVMHREIMKAQLGDHVDHIDGNPLNNQKSNLRILTPSDNAKRKTKVPKRGGKYQACLRGVSKTRSGKYRALITCGKTITLGTFNTEEEAGKAFDRASLACRGILAVLNYPEDI